MFNQKSIKMMLAGGLLAFAITSCKQPDPIPTEVSEETYAGGELGTTFNSSHSAYEDPTPAIEKQDWAPNSNMENTSSSAPIPLIMSLSRVSGRSTCVRRASPVIQATVAASA